MANLTEIAADMQRFAAVPGRPMIRRELTRGLVLEYFEAEGVANLRLSRPVTVPSEQEIAICRGAFGVPSEATRETGGFEVVLRWPKPTIE